MNASRAALSQKASYLAIVCLPLWNFFVINTQAIYRNTGEIENTVLIVTGVYLFMRLIIDIFVSRFSSRLCPLRQHTILVACCPTCMIIGTALVTCAANGWVGGLPLLIGGAALCGIGGEFMLLLWLELFVEISYKTVKKAFIAMIGFSALLSPLLLVVPSEYLFILCLALPILCIVGYHRASRFSCVKPENKQVRWHKPSFKGALPLGIGIATLYFGFHFLQSGFQEPLLESAQGYSIEVQSAIIGRWFAFVAVFLTVQKMKDFHYESMIKPAGIIGIAAFLMLPFPGIGFLAFCVLTIVACFLVDYAVSLAVVSIASFSDIPPLKLIGRGRATICIGGVFGIVVGSSLSEILNSENGREYLMIISALSVLLIAFSSIWLLRGQAISNYLWGKKLAASCTSPAPDNQDVTMICAIVSKRYSLTAREEQILNLLVSGRNAPYISNELCIGIETVRSHIQHIYQKLSVHNRQDLLTIVREQGKQE